MPEWIEVDDPNCYKIIVFDDGNQRYQKYENKWFITSKWVGKVRLINIDKQTEIRSISSWKLREDEN
tara:strand:+ start:288 stop:488 length:201 start_codon:yes stop_codon:yes gene_type:complete